ncbi:tRNA 2-selenouridine(34) synthase MnmH [Spirochaetota bacterium]
MKELSYKDSLKLDDPVYIDVRSPNEFSIDHIPGSINKPIFYNEERSEIGKIYRMQGKNDAIVKGIEMFGKRMSSYISDIQNYGDRQIVITCARGGMRSASVTSLLDSLGMKVSKIKNGYKGYRQFVNERLNEISIKPALFVIQGLTGVGKTEIIKKFKNSIDLEGIAGHRSSVFGAMGLEQNSQKRFDSLLYNRIKECENERYIVIEGESRKIGNLQIPQSIFAQMKASPSIIIEATIERRVDITLNEYMKDIDNEEVVRIVKSISTKIGKKNTDHLLNLFDKESYREFTEILLVKYYDPLYKHTLSKMDHISTVKHDNTDKAVREIKDSINTFLDENNISSHKK